MTIIFFITTNYLSEKESIYKSVDDKLYDGSIALKHLIGENLHNRNDSLSNEEYLILIKQMTQLQKELKLKYLYTLVLKDGKIYFNSSSATDEELQDNSFTKYMDEYEDASAKIHETFTKNIITYDEYTDKWGNFRSIFLPATTSQGNKYIIGADMEMVEVKSQINALLQKNILIGLALLILAPLFINAAAKRISKPIAKLSNDAQSIITKNDYNVVLSSSSHDETKTLADTLNILINSLKKTVTELKEEKAGIEQKVEDAVSKIKLERKYLDEKTKILLGAMDKLANGDLTVELEIENDDQIGKLFEEFNRSVRNISELIEKLIGIIQTTADVSVQISSSSEAMAIGAHEQSSQTREVVGAIEEMTKTIIDATKNSAEAAETAQHSGAIAKEGGKVVSETIQGMIRIAEVVNKSAETIKTLGKSSDQIGEIIQVIDDIADQTNLLALNAAIESARAGEQGRGFAVVADEVRKLAERTTKATKEIASMIKAIQKDTEDAVCSIEEGTAEVEKGKQLANQASTSLEDIIKSADEVVNKSSQVAAASEEQSSTSEQISKNVEAINNVTQKNATGIQQISHASENLNMLTTDLQELISNFKIDEQKVVDIKDRIFGERF